MATKRKAFVHIGLDDGSGDFIDGALDLHARALAELGIRSPAVSGEEMFRAALEILRTHRDWGYQRAEVEGAWTTITRRGHQGRDTLVFSQSLLAGARPEQVALLVDALAGFEVHVIVTVSTPGTSTIPADPRYDLGAALASWVMAVRRPERLHVIVSADPQNTWTSFGRVVGFGTSSLKITDLLRATHLRPALPTPASRIAVLRGLGESWVELLAHSEYDVVGDVTTLVPDPTSLDEPEAVAAVTEHALRDALAEVERLTRRNESLLVKITGLEKKRQKLKRKLRSVA